MTVTVIFEVDVKDKSTALLIINCIFASLWLPDTIKSISIK